MSPKSFLRYTSAIYKQSSSIPPIESIICNHAQNSQSHHIAFQLRRITTMSSQAHQQSHIVVTRTSIIIDIVCIAICKPRRTLIQIAHSTYHAIYLYTFVVWKWTGIGYCFDFDQIWWFWDCGRFDLICCVCFFFNLSTRFDKLGTVFELN